MCVCVCVCVFRPVWAFNSFKTVKTMHFKFDVYVLGQYGHDPLKFFWKRGRGQDA